MLTVSNEYKEAIKKDVRNFDISAIILNTTQSSVASFMYDYENYADLGSLDSLFDNSSYIYNYACLEQDYFRLDGSFILPNRSDNKYTGFIATAEQCSLSFGTSPYLSFYDEGMTIVFDKGYATNFTISYYEGGTSTQMELIEEHTYTNDKDTVYVVPASSPTIGGYKQIKITINEWSNDNFPRIKKILKGNNMLLNRDDIINVKMLEETDLRGLSIPSNSFSITLDNYDRQYNILDADNILNKMGSYTSIITYLGLNIDGHYEYIYIGEYNYKGYKENSSKTIELNFTGKAEIIGNYNSSVYNIGQTYTPDQVRRQIFVNLSEDTNCLEYSGNFPCSYLPYGGIRQEQQLEALIYYNASVRQTKNNRTNLLPFNIDVINKDIENYIIGLNMQIRNPEFKKINKVKTITFNIKELGALSSDKTEIYNAQINSNLVVSVYHTVVRVNTEMYVPGTSQVDIYYGDTKIYSNGAIVVGQGFDSVTSWSEGYHILYFDFTSSNAKNGTYRVETKYYPKLERKVIVENENINNGALIDITTNTLTDSGAERVGNKIISYEETYPYEFETEIMGDVRLEVGDRVRIESLDGYHIAVIERIDTTYNGGLTQIIKGVSSGVL